MTVRTGHLTGVMSGVGRLMMEQLLECGEHATCRGTDRSRSTPGTERSVPMQRTWLARVSGMEIRGVGCRCLPVATQSQISTDTFVQLFPLLDCVLITALALHPKNPV